MAKIKLNQLIPDDLGPRIDVLMTGKVIIKSGKPPTVNGFCFGRGL
jgi:hypothetical protein